MSTLKKALTSSFLLSADAVLRKMVGVVSTLILARYLTPEDFGIVALALMTMGLLDAMKQLGSSQYVMRAKEVTADMLNTAWTVSAIGCVICALLLFAFSYPVANYFDDERLVLVLYVYASLFLVKGAGNPGANMLKREQNYLPIVKLGISAKIISVVLTIIAALTLQNYWALVIGQYSITLVSTVGTYFLHPHRPRPCFNEFSEQWKFSSWFMLQSSLGYIRSQLDTFLVGSIFSKASLGSYHTMKYLASIPTTYFLGPATEPLLVQLTRIKDNKEYFSLQYNVSIIVPLCFCAPIVYFLSLHHELSTLVVLGNNWTEYSVLFPIFCFSMITILVQQHAFRVLVIDAKTKQIFYVELISFFLIYGIILWVNTRDVYAFASLKIGLEMLTAILVFTVVTLSFTSFLNFVRVVVGIVPIFAALALAGILSKYFMYTDIPLLQLLTVGAGFCGSYALALAGISVVFKLFSDEWKYMWGLVKKVQQKYTSKKRVEV